jgi:hypothetical protein
MKRIFLIAAIVLALGLLCQSVAWGRAEDHEGLAESITALAPPENNTWFVIAPEPPGFACSISYCIDDPLSSFGYYLNDQTWVYLNYQTPGDILNIKGSYLFDFGLFAAVDYYSNGSGVYYVTPGYRFNLKDQGYVALSLDYRSNGATSGIVGYKAAGAYYTDTVSVSADCYLDVNNGLDFKAEANFKAHDELVWGAGLASEYGSLDYYAGLTWMKSAFVVDALAGNNVNGVYYDLNGTYAISDSFGAGVECEGGAGLDPVFTCKGTYSAELFDIGLMYSFPTNYTPAMVYLTYDLKL